MFHSSTLLTVHVHPPMGSMNGHSTTNLHWQKKSERTLLLSLCWWGLKASASSSVHENQVFKRGCMVWVSLCQEMCPCLKRLEWSISGRAGEHERTTLMFINVVWHKNAFWSMPNHLYSYGIHLICSVFFCFCFLQKNPVLTPLPCFVFCLSHCMSFNPVPLLFIIPHTSHNVWCFIIIKTPFSPLTP